MNVTKKLFGGLHMSNAFFVTEYIKEGMSDSEAIRACLLDAEKCESRTIVFAGKDFYLDEAIVLSSNTTV